jgi:GAF domain-containing protein
MELIPEVEAAAVQLAGLAEETVDLVEGLNAVANLARTLLPSCVGVSITVIVDGDPFTVTATSEDVKAVDSAQYLDNGPCVHAAATGEHVLVDDVLDERRWQWYAQAASANGIRASMSLPLSGADRRPMGALNLYAADAEAFQGKEQQLAELFGAQANQLTANADLSFMTRQFAEELPQRLEEHERINQAVGVLMASHGWTAAVARERLDYAASHAQTSRANVARIVMVLDT